MRAQPFDESNLTLTAPAGQPDVMDLQVLSDGERVVSCWKPSPAELEALNRGEPVWLSVWSGSTAPPVSVWAGGLELGAADVLERSMGRKEMARRVLEEVMTEELPEEIGRLIGAAVAETVEKVGGLDPSELRTVYGLLELTLMQPGAEELSDHQVLAEIRDKLRGYLDQDLPALFQASQVLFEEVALAFDAGDHLEDGVPDCFNRVRALVESWWLSNGFTAEDLETWRQERDDPEELRVPIKN